MISVSVVQGFSSSVVQWFSVPTRQYFKNGCGLVAPWGLGGSVIEWALVVYSIVNWLF
jgi:hypothetical protein